MSTIRTLDDLFRAEREQKPTPVQMPLMPGNANAAKNWHDAIAGRAPEIGFSNTRAAAEIWLNQDFADKRSMDPAITVAKA